MQLLQTSNGKAFLIKFEKATIIEVASGVETNLEDVKTEKNKPIDTINKLYHYINSL